MKPCQQDPKIYRTVRLQNTSGSEPWFTTVGNIFANISPAFQKMQVVSWTIYGPFLAGASSILTAPTTHSTYELSSEMIVTPSAFFTNGQSVIFGPVKIVAPGGSRHGYCHWHYSDRDQASQFNTYSNTQ